jgi:putative solute:sodium symporter small subunit
VTSDDPPGTGGGPPARVRVRSTDPLPDDARSAAGEDAARGERAPSGTRTGREDVSGDAATLYTRGLVRAQLRLALACVASFLVVVALLTVTMSGVPELDSVVLLGVPLPWLVHAYGFYPVIVAFAVVFAVAAARNERRFRALAEEAEDA